jgi:hypothetical protein
MFSTCRGYQFCWSTTSNEDQLDYEYLEGLCDSNAIVEITLQRDFLLLKLQEVVDSTTSPEADKAIKAMDDACPPDDYHLLRFLVRAGTISILHDVLNRDVKDGRPSPTVASSLLRKLSKYDELRKSR